MFARMAKMETELAKRAPEEGDQEDGERKKRKTEDGEVEEDAPVEEDEDDYQDDDDYYQVTQVFASCSCDGSWIMKPRLFNCGSCPMKAMRSIIHCT